MPAPIQDALVLLQDRHLGVEHIFRVPGSAETVEKLIEKINRQVKIDMSQYSCHELCGIIKSFYTRVPKSLCGDVAVEMLAAAGDPPKDAGKLRETLASLRAVMTTLDAVRAVHLSDLMEVAVMVSSDHSTNKMPLQSICTVFANVIMNAADGSLSVDEAVRLSRAGKMVCAFLCCYRTYLFGLAEKPVCHPGVVDGAEVLKILLPEDDGDDDGDGHVD